MTPLPRIVIGGGAAGFFGAIVCAETNPDSPVILLEKGSQVLNKVRISGGGRCNVTHACFDPAQLVHFYPRGHKALRGPFTRFQPRDTIDWFKQHGVDLKAEADGRMFPVSNSSQTIVNCLVESAQNAQVQLRCKSAVEGISRHGSIFHLNVQGAELLCDRLLVATGSNRTVWDWLESLGHTIIPPVPSLFTFNTPTFGLQELSGVSVEQAHLQIVETGHEQTGPLLITHWGFSGPAVLKLSAWAARELHALQYQATLRINWLPHMSANTLLATLRETKVAHPNRLISSDPPVNLPKKLWKTLTPSTQRWANASNQTLLQIARKLQADTYLIEGKTTYKEEFVTCGGVCLDEVNFKTMESRLCPGLHFAGEILDIDGVTGGFNFQNAWTTGFLAGHAMSG